MKAKIRTHHKENPNSQKTLEIVHNEPLNDNYQPH